MGVKLKQREGKGWYVFTNWRGQRKAKFFGKEEKRAQAFAEQMEARLELVEKSGGTVCLSEPKSTMPTVKEYLTTWRDDYAQVHCKPSTYRGYARAIERVLIPAFGKYPLDQLGRDHVRGLIADLSKRGKARGTVENCLVPLKAIYYQAMEDRIVQFNPAARLAKIFGRKKDRRATIGPLERKEVGRLLKTARGRFPILYPVLLCAVRTGMREGELIGLQWGDIDFHGGFIEVRRGIVLRQETTTKTHKIRRVDMSRQLEEALQQLKEVRQLEAMANGRELEQWVFLSPEGKRWDDRNLRRAWHRCLDAAGLRQVRFHDLRHTFASELAVKGAPPKYVQCQLGHSSIQVTMDVYSHLFEGRSREWVNKLDEPVDNSLGKPEPATLPQPEGQGHEQLSHKSLENMVAVEGFEPTTRGL